MSVRLSERPGGVLDSDAGEIRMPASSAEVALATMHRVNWLLGYHGCGLIFSQHWHNPVASWTSGGFYHRPATDCNAVVVVALVEGATVGQSGSFTFTPASGSPTTVCSTSADVGADRFTGGRWQVAVSVIDLATTGLQQHGFAMDYVEVHALSVWEAHRLTLDVAGGDKGAERRYGAWAGLEVGRRITESTVAGVTALLTAIKACKDELCRHFSWCVPTSQAWSATGTASSWLNLADGSLGTSGFGWEHRARKLQSGDTTVDYDCRFYCLASDASGVDLRISSDGDNEQLTDVGDSWAWRGFDNSGDRVAISCSADDTIVPETYLDDSGYSCSIAGFSAVEYR